MDWRKVESRDMEHDVKYQELLHEPRLATDGEGKGEAKKKDQPSSHQ